VEQACACFLAQTRVCRYDHELSRLEDDRNVRDVLAQRLRTRTRDGRRDAQVQNVSVHDAGMSHLVSLCLDYFNEDTFSS
jgi:hypothetical protein